MKNNLHPLKTFKRQVNFLSFILLGILSLAILSSWQQSKLTSSKNLEQVSHAETLRQSDNKDASLATDLIENNAGQSEQEGQQPSTSPNENQQSQKNGYGTELSSEDSTSKCSTARAQADNNRQLALEAENARHASRLLEVTHLTDTLEKAEKARHSLALQQIEDIYAASLKQLNC